VQKIFFASLQKVEDGADDTITVHGIASTEDRDTTGEIILGSAIRKALPAYRQYPAVREMHGLVAAGTALEIDVDADNITRITALIVDPMAIKKVRSGTYRGFSVGGKVLKRDPKDSKTITEILLTEVSLVDRPANGEAKIGLWKAAGLHDGAESTADLAKITGERDALAKAVAHRNRVLGDLADRIEPLVKTVAELVKQNEKLQAANADLTKRLFENRAQSSTTYPRP
jgi:hypothetical protein